ncbi:MAG: response regulator [Candidatus Omnitrophota bacterium]|jgi:DNA-binding response OmpR family regulator
MKKIMMVDDDKDLCFFLKKNLEKDKDMQVTVCSESRDAVKVIKEVRPDVVLLDIMMPGKSGIDIASELRNGKDTKNIPIIFLTAIIKEEEIEKHKNLIGEGYYISKPVEVEDLIKAINKVTVDAAPTIDMSREKVRIVTFLSREQIDFLDKLGKDTLFHTGYKLSRSETLDELVTLLMELKINFREIDLSSGLARGILKVLGR